MKLLICYYTHITVEQFPIISTMVWYGDRFVH
jgi:hypothetical protein